MPRSAIWKSIAETLASEIAAGNYQPGAKLPTEAELATRFSVNRHTIRHALQDLADRGLVHSRRGSGVYVTTRPTDYALGRRVRFQQNIAASGRTPSRLLRRLETRPCNAVEAEMLRLTEGEAVHVVEGTSLVDGHPMAMFRSVFPAALLPDLLRRISETQSVTAALAGCGVPDYTRQSTRITAKLATAMQALALHLPEGAPILRAEAINADPAGQPVEYGVTWFAGDRVTLTYTPD